jgi:hypothetical protein
MTIPRFVSVLALAALVRSAPAQLVPPPLTATVVNFDDLVGCSDILSCVPIPPDTYNSLGITISGFGQNGAIVFDAEGSSYLISPPNSLFFFSAFPLANGGLIKGPETFTFYPPVQSLQFDTATFSGCDLLVTVSAFAPDGSVLGNASIAPVEGGVTLALAFPPPGAQTVLITDAPNPLCGIVGLEAFSIDNIAFVSVPSGVASKCAQGEIDAAGKKAKAEASCYSKALQKGLPVDPNCIQKAVNTFNSSVTKSQDKGDCVVGGRHGDNQDVSQLEAAVDNLIANSVQMVTGGQPGPDTCFGKKLAAIGKKAQSMTKCWSKAAQTGTSADEACAQKAASSFNGSLKACGTPTQLAPLELLIDQFGSALSRSVTVPTTTTTTTTTSTTTTTLPPPLGQHLSFTTTAGTTNCGSGQFSTPADPPFSGELDYFDTVLTKLVDLGLGCLYIGGGAATVNPSVIPENATTVLDSPDGTTLTGSLGTGRADCSVGPQGSTKHCVNNTSLECTSDGDCFAPGGCQSDPTCYFGPPVLVNGFPSSCVVNAFAQDASGTLNQATGESTVDIELSSFVYLTLGKPSVCPTCDNGSGFCNYGVQVNFPCTTNNSTMTSLDCLPDPGTFVATLAVSLNPLTSSPLNTQAADGLFCPSQPHAGAFGQPMTQAITQNGSPAGDLTDGLPHAGVLVSNFCIPPTGSPALDNLADLPGPGSLSLPGNAQFFAMTMCLTPGC